MLVLVECYLKSEEDGGMFRSGPSEEPRVDHRESGASRAVAGADLKEVLRPSVKASSFDLGKINCFPATPVSVV